MPTLQLDLRNFPCGDTPKLYNFSACHSGEKPNRNLPTFWQNLRANIQGNNPESQLSKGYITLGTPKNFEVFPNYFLNTCAEVYFSLESLIHSSTQAPPNSRDQAAVCLQVSEFPEETLAYCLIVQQRRL